MTVIIFGLCTCTVSAPLRLTIYNVGGKPCTGFTPLRRTITNLVSFFAPQDFNHVLANHVKHRSLSIIRV